MKRLTVGLLLALCLGAGPTPSALARQWNPTPMARAQEYLRIMDQRSAHSIIMVMWMAPQLVPAGPQADAVKRILEDHIVIALVHADLGERGAPTFRTVTKLNLKTFAGRLIPPLDMATLEPAVAGTIVALQRGFSHSVGQLGQGTSWFVFDGTWNRSCGKGGFWVPYRGTDYEYRTPIPGC